MSNVKTIQLELKNLLFCEKVHSTSKSKLLELEGGKLSIRKGTDEFLTELANHFRIGLWSRFKPKTHEQLHKYIEDLGIEIIYSKSLKDCTQIYQDNEFWTLEKRIKILNHLGIELTSLITLETSMPVKENYGNHYIISEFKGQSDNDLLDCLIELIDLKNVNNTTRIN